MIDTERGKNAHRSEAQNEVRPSLPRQGRTPVEAARAAAAEALRVKRESPDNFGVPELFVVRDGGSGFTWELRRFGGVLLQRGAEVFPSQALARNGGEAALKILCASPDLPTFKRELP